MTDTNDAKITNQQTITWQDFQAVKLRVGQIISAEPFPKARKPAFIVHVNFGDAIYRYTQIKGANHRALYTRVAHWKTSGGRCEFPAQADWADHV
jgi:hypothetical protein